MAVLSMHTNLKSRRLATLSVGGGVVAGIGQVVYGLTQTPVLAQNIWFTDGAFRFLTFCTSYFIVCLLIFLLNRSWLAPVLALGTVFVMITSVGILPVAALAIFVATAIAIGDYWPRRQSVGTGWNESVQCFLRGTCVLALAVGVAAHFPVNSRAVYAGVALLVLVWRGDALLRQMRPLAGLLAPADVGNPYRFWTLAAAVFVIASHLLVSLKPELGYDALVTHLMVPNYVSSHGSWHFDVGKFVWSAMPMAGAWVYTATFLLGGEFAARLVNVLFMAVTSLLIYGFVRQWASRTVAAGAVALFASTPIVQLVTGSMFIENMLACMILAGALAFQKAWRHGRDQDLIFGSMFLGTALATKFGAVSYIIGVLIAYLAGNLLRRGRRNRIVNRQRKALLAAGVLVLFGSIPYVYCWAITGNPFFPFLNHIFRSPLFPTEPFRNPFFPHFGLLDAVYALTFRTHEMLEGNDGAAGFQYLLFFPALALLIFARSALRTVWIPGFAAVFSSIVIFVSQPNARYLYPAMALLSVVIAWIITLVIRQNRLLGLALSAAAAVALALNLYLLPAASHLHRNFWSWSVSGDESSREYRDLIVPARSLVEFLNLRYPGETVWFLDSQAVAGLRGEAVLSNWYSPVFAAEVAGCRTPDELLRLARRYGIRHVIAQADFSSKAPFIREFLQEFSEKSWEVSGLSAFRIRAKPQTFKKDLLPLNEAATGWKDWQRNGNPKLTSDGAITVNSANTLVSGMLIEEGTAYRLAMETACEAGPAQFRLQLNWHDADSKFIGTKIDVQVCDPQWRTFQIEIAPPAGARSAVVIVGGHEERYVKVREVSLKY